MSTLSAKQLIHLKDSARSIRQSIITMLEHAQSGHSGGSLGMTDVFTTLYFHTANHKPNQPDWEERDRVLVSNGHICPVWYATLAEAGYFPKEELQTLRQINSRLQGHPHLGSLPGIENTSGPLAQGFSQALGLAYALKMDGKKNRVFCSLSDGEHQEGQVWEAYLFGGKYKLNNLVAFIDRNNIQIDGTTDSVMPLEPLKEKLEAFNWRVLEINGHDFTAIVDALTIDPSNDKPTVIICKTIPGKGVSFMENKYEWHGKSPTPEQAKQALAELSEVPQFTEI
jgi:transketolase